MPTLTNFRVTHLRQLGAESIYILREVAADFGRPVLLYSIGKDSSVMLHLASKACRSSLALWGLFTTSGDSSVRFDAGNSPFRFVKVAIASYIAQARLRLPTNLGLRAIGLGLASVGYMRPVPPAAGLRPAANE